MCVMNPAASQNNAEPIMPSSLNIDLRAVVIMIIYKQIQVSSCLIISSQ